MVAPRRGMTGIMLIGGAGEGGGGDGGGGDGGGGDGGGDGGGGGEGGGGEGGGGDGERNCEKMRTSARLRMRLSPGSTIVTYQPVMP